MEIKSIFSTTQIKYMTTKLTQKTVAFFMLLFFSLNIFGGIIPDPASIGTRVGKTASGVDQIDIAAPSVNGTSYNSLMELQVSERGLVLNNSKEVITDTEIAGLVIRNRNLDNGKEANLIITEIKGKNQTGINGYVEVAGKKADIVIANRNGIIVNGGGFINTDRVTLTTGKLNMKDGDLKSIDVSEGKVKIGDRGVDALNLADLELIGKTVDISGIIKGSKDTKILISAGGQTYEYKTKEVKSKGETYTGVAIDGKTAGSMYAGKIDIISNDKGAGVNTQGDLLSVDEIMITADGRVQTNKANSEKQVATTKNVAQPKKQQGREIIEKKVFTTEVKVKEPEVDAKMITGYMKKALGEEAFQEEIEVPIETEGVKARLSEEAATGEAKEKQDISINEEIATNVEEIISVKSNKKSGDIKEVISERINSLKNHDKEKEKNKIKSDEAVIAKKTGEEAKISEIAEEIFSEIEKSQVYDENGVELDITEIANREGYILVKEEKVKLSLSDEAEELLVAGVEIDEEYESPYIDSPKYENTKNVVQFDEIQKTIEAQKDTESIKSSKNLILNSQLTKNRQGLIEGEIRNIKSRSFINDSGKTMASQKIKIVTKGTQKNSEIK